MSTSYRLSWPAILLFLSLLGLGSYYLFLSQYFPYDFIWDMDATTAQDVLIYNSGGYPTHNDHPKFFMVMALSLCAQVAHFFGGLSAIDTQTLQNAPEPFFAIAELTTFLKAIQSLFTVGFIGGLCLLGWHTFPRFRGVLPIFALALGLQSGPLYMAMTTRSELFAAFLIVLGLIPALRLEDKNFSLSLRFWLSGLCFGLAILTKIQAIPLLLLMFCFWGYQWSRQSPQFDEGKIQGKGHWFLLGTVCFLGLLAFLTPFFSPLPGRLNPMLSFSGLLEDFSLGRLKLQVFWTGFLGLALLSSLWAYQYRFFAKQPLADIWKYALSRVGVFVAGTVSAFVLPLFVFLGRAGSLGEALRMGANYTATLMRSVILLDGRLLSQGGNNNSEIFSFVVAHRWDYFALFTIVLVFLIYQAQFLKAKDKTTQYWTIALSLSCLALLVFGNRPILRDTFWFEVWIFWGAYWGIAHLASLYNKEKSVLVLSGLVLCVPLSISVFQLPVAQAAFYIHNSNYGGDVNPYDYYWAETVYLRKKNSYAEAIRSAYNLKPVLLKESLSIARDWQAIKHLVVPQFPNTEVSLSDVGVLNAGHAMWKLSPKEWARVGAVSSDLASSFFVGAHRLQLAKKSQYYAMHYTNKKDFSKRFQGATAPKFDVIAPFYGQTFLAISRADLSKRNPKAVFNKPSPLQALNAQGSKIDYEIFSLKQKNTFDQNVLNGLDAPVFFIFRKNLNPLNYPEWKTN